MLVSYNVNNQWRSRNLANMFKMSLNGVSWSLPNKDGQFYIRSFTLNTNIYIILEKPPPALISQTVFIG